MICRSCGRDVPDNATFCIHCGTRIQKECPECAELVNVRASVCRFCGYKFSLDADLQMELAAERPLPRESAREAVEYRQTKDFRDKNPKRMISRWGDEVYECPDCLNINAIGDVPECFHCGASLNEDDIVPNPFVISTERSGSENGPGGAS